MAQIFISYKRVDKDKVFSIVEKIEYELGCNCFVDLDGIESSVQFASVICFAIDKSDVVLFMHSSAHLTIDFENDWTVKELTYAQAKKKRVVLVKLDNTPLDNIFLLNYGSRNNIDSQDPTQFNKLLNDLRSWLDLSHQKSASQFEAMCPCGSGKLFKDCHGRTVAPTPKPVENAWKVGDYYTHGEKDGVVFWVDETGRYGKIVSVDEQMLPWCTEEEYESGLSLISFSDSNGMLNLQSIMQIPDWRNKYPAFAWCADHGENWYLPAIDELKELLLNDDVREKINGMLEQKGRSTMCRQPVWDSIVLNEPFDGGVDGYWSSTINGRWQAHIVDTLFFRMGESNRTYCFAVRAVSTFDERWLESFEI